MQVSHSLRRLQTRSDEDDSSWVYLAQPQRQFTSPLSNIHETNVQAFEYNEPQDKNGIVRPSTTQNLNQSQDLSQLGLSPGSVAFSDAEYIHQSYEGLDTVTQLMNRSLDEISRLCHWKTGPQNFSEKPADVELISLKLLGKGSDGEVDEVRVSGNFDDAEHFVRKAISIRWGEQEAKMNKLAIKREVENLKKVSVHPHIVKIIGWYQETTKWGREFAFLLTYPVGEGNLDRFFQTVKKARLKGLHEQTAIYRLWLKKWFYCLASALAFMHANNLHHKDIKPLNVIHRGDCIYFTDFGSSRSFENGQSTCTESYAKATMLFAAPEAWQNDDEYKPRHGSKADVFSLGLLFMEMMTTLFDGDIDELRDFVFGNGYGKRQYCHVTNRFEGWFKNRMERGNFNTYIKPMLADHKDDRPSAEEVKMNIWGNCMWGEVMACPCKDSQNE
jgi:serine/threonine protein kinase